MQEYGFLETPLISLEVRLNFAGSCAGADEMRDYFTRTAQEYAPLLIKRAKELAENDLADGTALISAPGA